MCEAFKLPDGSRGFICGEPYRTPPCVHCGKPSTSLCDHRGAAGPGLRLATCSAPLCGGCALHVGKNRDYCRVHAQGRATAALPFET